MKKPSYIELFLTFLKIGAFTFGGGYAMISLIENELVTKKQWVDKDTFYNYISIAQMSPGILAVNISILMGNLFFGKKGAVLCVIATVLPSFTVILSVAVFLSAFKDSKVLNSIFRGISPIVVALIILPVISLFKRTKLNFKTAIIPIIIVVLICVLNISPIYIILGAIVIAVIFAKFGKEL